MLGSPERGLSTFRTKEQAELKLGPQKTFQVIDLNVIVTQGFEVDENPITGHVSIRPPSQEKLEEWANTRPSLIEAAKNSFSFGRLKVHYLTIFVMIARSKEVSGSK